MEKMCFFKLYKIAKFVILTYVFESTVLIWVTVHIFISNVQTYGFAQIPFDLKIAAISFIHFLSRSFRKK